MLRQTYRLSGLGLSTPNVHCVDIASAVFATSRGFTKISRGCYFLQVVNKGVNCGIVESLTGWSAPSMQAVSPPSARFQSSGVQRSRNDARLKGNKYAGIHVGIPRF